jgi:hypothetical protein
MRTITILLGVLVALVLAGFVALWLSAREATKAGWQIQVQGVQITTNAQGVKASVVADCRGANRLDWQVDDARFQEPSQVSVFCTITPSEPVPGVTAWGRSLDVTTDGSTANDKYRAKRDSERIAAPWCILSFHYPAGTTVSEFSVQTYCHNASGL